MGIPRFQAVLEFLDAVSKLELVRQISKEATTP